MDEGQLPRLAAAELSAGIVEKVLDHRGTHIPPRTTRGRKVVIVDNPSPLQFLVRWQGFQPAYDSWISYSDNPTLLPVLQYLQQHPSIKV